MKNLLLALTICGLTVLGTACATGAAVKDSSAAADAIAAAKAARKQAAGNEWRDVGKFLKKAEKLAAEGKTEEAIKLANKVKMQSEMAIKQAESQKNAGPSF